MGRESEVTLYCMECSLVQTYPLKEKGGDRIYPDDFGCVVCGETTFVSSPPPGHVLAALALHDQPFGFTWEMVDALRAAIVVLRELGYAPNGPARFDLLPLAADRIEALLPPRGGRP